MKNLHTFAEFLNESKKGFVTRTSVNEGRLMPKGYIPSKDVKDGPEICKSIIEIVKKYAKLDTRKFKKLITKSTEDDPYIEDNATEASIIDFYIILSDYVALETDTSKEDKLKMEKEITDLINKKVGIEFD